MVWIIFYSIGWAILLHSNLLCKMIHWTHFAPSLPSRHIVKWKPPLYPKRMVRDTISSQTWHINLTTYAEDHPCTYLCGNSLGLLPKCSKELIEEELEVWATRYELHFDSFIGRHWYESVCSEFNRAVDGHFDHPYNRPWMYIADTVHPLLANIIGEQQIFCFALCK